MTVEKIFLDLTPQVNQYPAVNLPVDLMLAVFLKIITSQLLLLLIRLCFPNIKLIRPSRVVHFALNVERKLQQDQCSVISAAVGCTPPLLVQIVTQYWLRGRSSVIYVELK